MHQRNLSTSTPSFGTQPSTFGQANAPKPTFSFGASQPANAGAAPAFGAQPTLFGQSSLSQQAQPKPAFSFGATAPSTTPAFGSQALTTQLPQSQPTLGGFGANTNILNQKLEHHIWQQLALIKAKWDTKSPLCYFKHFFYNMVHPDEVHRYAKPAEIDPYLWAEAMRNNPDPTCMVPALAVGFDDVRKRMEGQYRQCAVFKDRLEAIDQKLEHIQRKHILETMTRLAEHKRRHIDLTRRTIQADEDHLRLQLEKTEAHLQRSEEFNEKLNQLWQQIQQIRDQQRDREIEEKWALTSEKDVQVISEILSRQHDGLAHVIAVCQTDLKDLDTMISGTNSRVGNISGK
ncbi:Nucleoporin nup57 [Umbelopsis nana]